MAGPGTNTHLLIAERVSASGSPNILMPLKGRVIVTSGSGMSSLLSCYLAKQLNVYSFEELGKFSLVRLMKVQGKEFSYENIFLSCMQNALAIRVCFFFLPHISPI